MNNKQFNILNEVESRIEMLYFVSAFIPFFLRYTEPYAFLLGPKWKPSIYEMYLALEHILPFEFSEG
jgi:hypothetical protein